MWHAGKLWMKACLPKSAERKRDSVQHKDAERKRDSAQP
jgi:hypothetical protein